MSELGVKSWRGTYFQTSGVKCCVIFKTLSIARANLVLMYFNKFLASFSELKHPTLMNVSVEPTLGTPIIGAVRVSPNVPFPFPLGRKIL